VRFAADHGAVEASHLVVAGAQFLDLPPNLSSDRWADDR